jgi:REP element-mobilizing transposase RayT
MLNKQPTRKANRLHDYDYSSNGAYFITICTKDRQAILWDEGYLAQENVGEAAYSLPQIILSPTGEMVQKIVLNIPDVYKHVSVDAYVIMPNHIHMIILLQKDGTPWAASPTISISKIINSFKTITSKQYGRPLWQRSFHDHIIRGQKDYDKIKEYIHSNPLQWQNDYYHE